MYRRYAYRPRRAYTPKSVKPVKYSCEHKTFTGQNTTSTEQPVTNSVDLVAGISAQGMRKAKNFTLDLSSIGFPGEGESGTIIRPVYWALVYVPEGSPGDIKLSTPTTSTSSLYEPNQNVIMSGIITSDGQKNRFTTKLARNLNSNDKISLLYLLPQDNAAHDINVNICLTYAITY